MDIKTSECFSIEYFHPILACNIMASSEYDFFFVVFNNLTEDVKIKSILKLSYSADIVNIGMVDQFIVVFIADFGNESFLEFHSTNLYP